MITLDVGGTSADIGVAPDASVRMKHLYDTNLGGYEVMVPMVDLDTIGAGGGSLARVDAGGLLRVGPQSAGADPGPACYGRGGTEPTATDAQVVLGRMRPEAQLAGGAASCDLEAAREAIGELGAALGLGRRRETAVGITQILTQNMVNAISVNSVQKGFDPRDFSLVAFGGGGPLYGADIATELSIPRVIVPPHPGITSAMGLLDSDLKYESQRTVMVEAAEADPADARAASSPSSRPTAARALDADEVAHERPPLPALGGLPLRRPGLRAARAGAAGAARRRGAGTRWPRRFEQTHEREYFYRFPDEAGADRAPALLRIGLMPSGARSRRSATATASRRGGRSSTGARCLRRAAPRPAELDTPFYDRERAAGRQRASRARRSSSSSTRPPSSRRASATRVLPDGAIVIDCATRGGLSMSSDTRDAALDPITLGVLGGAFQAIGLEMGHALKRMAYSPAAQQVEDLGGGLFTVDGREICESDTTPMHIGSIPAYIRGLHAPPGGQGRARATSSSTTTPTTAPRTRRTCASRSRSSGRASCVAWSASTIHLSDIGGVFPGIAIDVHDVWAESKIYDSLKLYERGVRNEQLWQFFIDNTRTPSYVDRRHRGDDRRRAARREALPRPARALRPRRRSCDAVEEFLDYCERMMRAQIEAVPDGTWEAERLARRRRAQPRRAALRAREGHDRGLRHHRRPLEVLRQRADRASTCPSAAACCPASTRSSARCSSTRRRSTDFIPQNDGIFRPIKVIAREGSIFNPSFPRSALSRVCPILRVSDAAIQALAEVVPDRVCGGLERRSASASTPATSPRSRSTGSTSRSTRAPTAGAAARTASTRSTC